MQYAKEIRYHILCCLDFPCFSIQGFWSSLLQMIWGLGFPVALHVNFASSHSLTVVSELVSSAMISGETNNQMLKCSIPRFTLEYGYITNEE